MNNNKIYNVVHTNSLGIIQMHILDYLRMCKEGKCNILNIELRTNEFHNVTFLVSWPSKEEIISNGYEDIIIHITCDVDNFHCSKFVICDLDDSYYDTNNMHADQYETIPSIFIKNVTGDVIIKNCCSFYTNIIIDTPYIASLIIMETSYIDYLKLEHCANMYMMQLKDGSFINKLGLYKCIIDYGLYTYEKDKNNKSTINEIVITLSIIINYIAPVISYNYDVEISNNRMEPILLKNNNDIKLLSTESLIIEK